MDTTNAYTPFVEISPMDSSGVYFFPMVPEGNFVIYAIPFNFEYLPTYYGDVLNWQSATVVTLGTPANPYNIHLLQADSYTNGSGTISGQIVQGDISSAMINKVNMLLKDASGKTILHNQVNDAGDFEFPQLAFGTYYLHAELAGCNSSDIQVILSQTNPTADLTLALSGRSILGKSEAMQVVAGIVYPNPVKEEARISVTLSNSTLLKVELFTMAGQRVYSQEMAAGTGENRITIPAAGIANGVYVLKISSLDGSLITRKLVK
jgi:hypothetical protein